MLKRTHKIAIVVNRRGRLLAAALAAIVCVAAIGPATAETRSLKVYFVHTKERATITFKKNGRYVPGGLKKLNRFLRDWRQKESTKMDPRLFDLLWEVYQASGSKKHIHVVSAYRSPRTNKMLRKRSRGVAKKSQHIQGKAMDFYLPDVPIKKLRRIGMQFQVGGVGYYPKSGSPFVHLDVGSVRSWPRMNRKELSRVFPNGKTLHLPSDGKPLPGYNQALADYKARVSAKSIQVAGKRPTRNASGGGSLLAGLFGRKKEEDKPAPRSRQPETQVASVTVAPEAAPAVVEPELAYVPTPRSRPAPPDDGVQIALAAATATQIQATPAVFRQRLPGGAIPESGAVALSAPAQVNSGDALTVATLSNTAAAAPTPGAVERGGRVGGRVIPVPQLRTGTSDYAGTRVALAPSRNNPRPEVVLGALLTDPVLSKPAQTPLADNEWNQGSQTPANAGSADGPQLAYVPRPAQRPDVLSPDGQILAGVLDNSGTERLSGEPAIGVPVPTPSPLGASAPVQVALAPASGGVPVYNGQGIDMFPTSTAMPRTKGGRPSAADAANKRRSSVRTEPQLTENMITSRALTGLTLSSMGAAVTAPQFVSSYMRTAPQTVHVNGFSRDNRIAGASEFSGRAVNFMTVARFETERQ